MQLPIILDRLRQVWRGPLRDMARRMMPSPNRRHAWLSGFRRVFTAERQIALYRFLLGPSARFGAWAAIGTVLVVLLAVALALAPGAIPDTKLATASASFPVSENGVTPGDRELLRRMTLMAPLRPRVPQPQLVEPPPRGTLSFGTQDADIRGLITSLSGVDLANADPASRKEGVTKCPSEGVSIGSFSAGSDETRATRPGIENYHLAIAYLCNKTSADAANSFAFAADWFATALGSRDNRNASAQRRLSQYQAAALYGQALALAGWGDTDGSPILDARVDDATACKLFKAAAALDRAYELMTSVEPEPRPDPGRKSRAFAPADWYGSGLPLPLSTADLLDARLWIELRAQKLGRRRCGTSASAVGDLDAIDPGLARRIRAALRDGGSDRDDAYRATVARPSLAGNLAVVAMVAASKPAPDTQQTAFAGDIQGVRRLYSDFIASPLAADTSEPGIDAGRRVRYMAAAAGAADTRDTNDVALTCPVRQDRSAGGDNSGGDRDRADIVGLVCLQAMASDMKRGDAGAFYAHFQALRAEAGADPAYAAAAAERAAAYRGKLQDEERLGRPNYRYFTAILADADLFGGWGSLAPRLRLWFGLHWFWVLALAAACVGAAVWVLHKRAGLFKARARVLASRYHDERIRKGANASSDSEADPPPARGSGTPAPGTAAGAAAGAG